MKTLFVVLATLCSGAALADKPANAPPAPASSGLGDRAG